MIKQVAGLVGILGAMAIPTVVDAQVLPSPNALVSGLDLECYRTPGPALNIELDLTQLNPVLRDAGVPTQRVTIRELAQTCVPVRKNNSGPSASALQFVRQIDFACYKLEAPDLPDPLVINLTHLNPVLANLPAHDVKLLRAAQLCLPVAKNNQPPQNAVLALARHLDLECFEVDPDPHPMFGVNLHQLNPQLVGIPPHVMTLGSTPRQLCVPVRKNAQFIPPAILNIVQWVDLEKFAAVPAVNIAPVAVELQHLNPMFVNLPHEHVTLQQANSLMVPVAKDGRIPPND
jgi:hypothetical protein